MTPSAKKQSRIEGRPPMELLEEAFALLRRAPLGVHVLFGVGSVPFWLGLLYFLADMSQSAFASSRLAGASFGLALLYLWMKCWQAVYADRLRGLLLMEEGRPWTVSRALRLAGEQGRIQAVGLFIRPLAYGCLLPTVWASGFYRNATVLGAVAEEGKSTAARAWAQTCLRPGQAHAVFLFLLPFGFFVWVNVAAAFVLIPGLLKMLFGIESEATRSLGAMLNGTFFLSTLAVAMLCLDPLWQAVFVLRCFYGESLHSGDDLRVRLKSIMAKAAVLALLAMLGGGAAAQAGMSMATPPPKPAELSAPVHGVRKAPARVIPIEELDRSIGHELRKPEFAWRSPRREDDETAKGFLADILTWIRSGFEWLSRSLLKILKALLHWLFRSWPSGSHSDSNGGAPPIEGIYYGLIALLVVVLAWFGWSAWKNRRPTAAAESLPTAMPDLHSDDVQADQLPEDQWLAMVRELMEKGEFRLALRAAYLAGLAHLGNRDLLSLARHKSNLDYWRELRRRARTQAPLLAAFEDNLQVFERAWYGRSQVTTEILAHFTGNLERIRAC